MLFLEIFLSVKINRPCVIGSGTTKGRRVILAVPSVTQAKQILLHTRRMLQMSYDSTIFTIPSDSTPEIAGMDQCCYETSVPNILRKFRSTDSIQNYTWRTKLLFIFFHLIFFPFLCFDLFSVHFLTSCLRKHFLTGPHQSSCYVLSALCEGTRFRQPYEAQTHNQATFNYLPTEL